MALQPLAQGLNPEELPLELLHGELVCSGILASKDGDTVKIINYNCVLKLLIKTYFQLFRMTSYQN